VCFSRIVQRFLESPPEKRLDLNLDLLHVSMVSAWFWNLICLQFSLYYNWSKVPVTWNSKTRSFEFEYKSLFQFKLFYFNIYFVLGLLLQGSCFSVAICYFTHSRLQAYLSIEYVFVYIFFGVVIFFPLIAATVSESAHTTFETKCMS